MSLRDQYERLWTNLISSDKDLQYFYQTSQIFHQAARQGFSEIDMIKFLLRRIEELQSENLDRELRCRQAFHHLNQHFHEHIDVEDLAMTAGKHVYFGTLPLLADFYHKGVKYKKVNGDQARDFPTGKDKIFEVHWGCMISEEQFEEYGLDEKAIRDDGGVADEPVCQTEE